jgi:CHAT domain-containing protein/tetratricopeptide (TPR) repeat protein
MIGRMQDLLREPPDDEAWRRFDALPAAEREQRVHELKEHLDRTMRASPPEALGVARALERAAANLPHLHVIALRGRATAYHANGRAAEALAAYRDAAELYARAGERLEEARVLRSMVDVHQMSGDADAALTCAERARPVFAELGEERLLAQLDVNVGNVHFRRDETGLARASYRAARERFERLDDRVGLAFTDFNLGQVETSANRCDDAHRSFRSSRDIWEEVGMTAHVADCEYSLAYLDLRRGHFAEAVAGLEHARDVYAEGGKPSGVPLCDLDLAEVYLRLDARRDALEHAQRAAAAFEEQQLTYERAKAEVLQAHALSLLGRAEEAGPLFDRSAAAFRGLGNTTLLRALGVQVAAERVQAGDAASVIPLLEESCSVFRAQDQRLLQDLAQLTLARARLATGELAEAERLLVDLAERDHASALLDVLIASEAWRTRAELARERDDLDAAIEAQRAAVTRIESSLSHVPDTDVRVAFFRERHAPFAELAGLLALRDAPGDAGDALRALEQGKLGLPGAAPEAASPSPEHRAARERLDWLLGRRLDHELGALAGDENRPAKPPSDDELRAAQDELAALSRRARTRSAEPAAASPDARDAADAREPGETLVSYLTSTAGTFALVTNDGGVERVTLDLDLQRLSVLRERLELQQGKFLLGEAYLARHAGRLARAQDALLTEFGERLVAPLASALGDGPVVVSTHGPLRDLPFHAFHVDGAPWLRRHDVSYAGSVHQLAEQRRAKEDAPLRLLLCGGQEETAPDMDRELAALRARLGEGVVALDPRTVLTELSASATGADVLHLAAHGHFQRDHALFSGVRLGDTFLTAHDVRRARFDVGLVVLSGCHTGRSADLGGEQLLGLEAALLAAGARAVVSSLWTVLDADSADLMERFYELLQAGTGARAALAATQREFLAAGRPFHAWAPFRLTGDPDAPHAARRPG